MRTQQYFTRYFGIVLLTVGLAGCDPDSVDSVDFGVSIENTTIHVGDAVNFVFDGNPDYIVFYPGTDSCNYANHERTSTQLDSLWLSCKIDQVYTDLTSYKEDTIMHAFISTDFTGEQTPEAIAAATWIDISGYGENQLNMPVATTNPTIPTIHTDMDLTDYLEKDFFIGFRYLAGPNNNASSSYGKPRVYIDSLTLHKRELSKYVIKMDDAINEWGFSTVRVKVAKENNTNYVIATNRLTFFPDASTEKTKDVEVWMVSQKVTPTKVDPDRGIAIKSTNAKLASYQYTYDTPGTYTATFIATNANMWDSSRVLREVTVTVLENSSTETTE